MAEYLAPGVYVEEIPSGIRTIEGASTSTSAFVGVAERGPVNRTTLITNLTEFYAIFGRPLLIREQYYLGYAVENFFREGGTRCYVVRIAHYSNILDRNSLTAEAASREFNDESDTTALTVNAANEGAWGRALAISIQNSSKFGTSLDAALPAGTFDRITVENTDGIGRGTLLWLVNPILAYVTYSGTTLQFDAGSSFTRDPEGTPLSPADTIATNSLVVTPDFRFMAEVTAWVSGMPIAAATNIEPTLANLTIGATGNQDINGTDLPEGELVWIIEPASQAYAIVDRVEGQTVVFTGTNTTTHEFPVNSKVLSRDFTLRVTRDGDLLESFENLSNVQTVTGVVNLREYAPNRINLGGAASKNIRVTGTNSIVPMRNTAAANLSGTSINPDGLADLAPTDYVGNPASGTGLFALDGIDDTSILSVPFPRFTDTTVIASPASIDTGLKHVYDAATNYCEQRRYMFCIVDSKPAQNSTETLAFRNSLNASNYAAYYWPWINIIPAGQMKTYPVPPSGAIAGIYARTDQKRGVHKAPAGTLSGRVRSAAGIERVITKAEQDGLNNNGVNVIRSFPASGLNVWGARTLSTSSEWRYVNVRRVMNYIEKSIDDGTQWTVFEPNNLDLWKKIERNINSFLRGVWRSGALFGETENKAFRVKCNAETNTSETIELGQVITEIAVAVVKPAEFVIFRIRQFAAGSELEE